MSNKNSHRGVLHKPIQKSFTTFTRKYLTLHFLVELQDKKNLNRLCFLGFSEFCKIFKTSHRAGHFWTTASGVSQQIWEKHLPQRYKPR